MSDKRSIRRVLPSLSALAALEAAVRTRSFVAAARELNVTATAVSHQIIALEDLLGKKLFIRRNRRVEPTEGAKTALSQLQEGLSILARAVDHIKDPAPGERVTICADHVFATKWLVQKIGAFTREFPNIRVNVEASARTVDTTQFKGITTATLRRARVDLTVRFGTGFYSGMRVDHLFPVSLLPVCSPSLPNADLPLLKPADVLAYPLIHDKTRYAADPPLSWSHWLGSVGVNAPQLLPGLSCGSHALSIEAAIAGHGIALGLDPIVREDIAAGRLIAPIAHPIPTSFGFHLVSADEELPKSVALLRDWILREQEKTDNNVKPTKNRRRRE